MNTTITDKNTLQELLNQHKEKLNAVQNELFTNTYEKNGCLESISEKELEYERLYQSKAIADIIRKKEIKEELGALEGNTEVLWVERKDTLVRINYLEKLIRLYDTSQQFESLNLEYAEQKYDNLPQVRIVGRTPLASVILKSFIGFNRPDEYIELNIESINESRYPLKLSFSSLTNTKSDLKEYCRVKLKETLDVQGNDESQEGVRKDNLSIILETKKLIDSMEVDFDTWISKHQSVFNDLLLLDSEMRIIQ